MAKLSSDSCSEKQITHKFFFNYFLKFIKLNHLNLTFLLMCILRNFKWFIRWLLIINVVLGVFIWFFRVEYKKYHKNFQTHFLCVFPLISFHSLFFSSHFNNTHHPLPRDKKVSSACPAPKHCIHCSPRHNPKQIRRWQAIWSQVCDTNCAMACKSPLPLFRWTNPRCIAFHPCLICNHSGGQLN